MIIILGLVVLFFVTLALVLIMDDCCDAWVFFVVTAWGLGIAVVFTCCIVLPVNRASCMANIERFHSLEQTVMVARANDDISEVELAALQVAIADMNKDLASQQYWARNPFTNWFYPRAILDLKPIR